MTRELGEYGKAYREAFEGWSALEFQKASQPDLADTFEDASTQARLIMDMLEAEATNDFRQLIDYESAQAEDKTRTNIEAIRETPTYQRGGKIAETLENQIQARLASLPEVNHYSEADQKMATAFVVGRIARIAIPPKAIELPAEQASSPSKPEKPISNKLKIQVFTKDSMLLVNGVEAIPLAREVGSSKYTAEEESLIEEYRLTTLKFLADHPDEEFLASKIWQAIDRTGTPYSSSVWDNFIGEWLEDLEIRNQSLINVRKPSPVAKRRYYSLGDFSVDFETLNEDSGLEQLTIFKLSNGEVLAGKAGMLAHLLSRATVENPVVSQMLLDKRVYSDEELVDLKYPENILSGLVSTVRQDLREAGVEQQYRIEKVDTGVAREGRGRRNEPGYYMELLSSGEIEKRKAIHEANIIANYIYLRNGLLEALNLPTLPRATVDMLKTLDESVSQEELLAVRDSAYETIQVLFGTEGIEKLLNEVDASDPRYGLADWALPLLNQPESRQTLENALRADVERVVGTTEAEPKTGSQRIKRIDYNVKGVGTLPVNYPDEDFEVEHFSLALLASIDQDDKDIVVAQNGHDAPTPPANNDNGENLTRRKRREAKIREIRSRTVPMVRSAIHEMHQRGLHRPEGSLVPQIVNVFPKLTTETVERHIGKIEHKNHGRVSAADILYVHIVTETGYTINYEQKAIKEVVKEELEKYERGLERRQQANGRH